MAAPILTVARSAIITGFVRKKYFLTPQELRNTPSKDLIYGDLVGHLKASEPKNYRRETSDKKYANVFPAKRFSILRSAEKYQFQDILQRNLAASNEKMQEVEF